MFKQLKNQKGMTLIEIMVVLTIIGVIGTFAVVSVIGQRERALVKAAKIQMKNFESALDSFKLDNGFYPTVDQGLNALFEKPTSGRAPTNYPRGGYVKGGKAPLDPWGHEYLYMSPGSGNPYEIISLGADGEEGGEDVDADIKASEIGKERRE